MKNKKILFTGTALLISFIVWTILVQFIDVQAVGVNGTKIGAAAINTWFHKLTGVHLTVYTITDWLGLVPICICGFFGIVGLRQLIKRKSIFKVDADIVLLGIYYAVVIFVYLVFEMIPINYRPILIDGFMEASYPSSTTLLVLSVMPSLKLQIARRSRNVILRNTVNVFATAFSAFMIIGRLLSGVHWCTDIIGSVLLSTGLFKLYQFAVGFVEQRKSEQSPEV
ncbi:MAG: phosphatase PAP2 family protein [Clostridiales bacterium]|nr:phosphatase PAP2 family protein [Candidatus Apopatocola equi]